MPDEARCPADVVDFIDSCAIFPNGRNDDDVDAWSQCMNWLRSQDHRTGPDVELFPNRKKVELVLVRCPSCRGLRAMSVRWADASVMCRECSRGEVVHRWTFCSFWVERFTMEEIDEMASAIWGTG